MKDAAFQPDALPQPQAAANVHPDAEASTLLRPGPGIICFVWFVRLIAFVNLVSTFIGHKPAVIHWLAHWVPFELSEGRHFRMFLVAVLLFVLASGLEKGKRVAWLLTIATLALAPILHIGRDVIWPQVVMNLVLIGFLLFHHRYFVTRSDPKSVRLALVICPLLAVVLLVFGSIRLHDLRAQTSGGDDWASCIQTAFELVLVHNTDTQQPQTTFTTDFFSALRIGGTAIALLGLVLTLRPVLSRHWVWGDNREKARRIVDLYGDDTLDPYALLHDKRYFFGANDHAVVPYVLSGNFAVALANPIGPLESRPAAITEFALFCHHQGLEPVFYQVTEDLVPDYEKAGFSIFKIGEETRLQTSQFHLRGNDFQNLRTARNRAHKLGIRFRWYYPAHGIDEELEQQLTAISQSWLEGKKRKEMTFDMGSYSVEEIRTNGVGVAINASGKAIAFATWRAFNRGNGQVLDLMRALPTERNVMDFVLVESILYFRAQGIEEVSLGTAPLANTRSGTDPLVAEEKVVQFIYENLNRLYGYKSLFEFKRKYRPQWRSRYVAYHRGVQLPLVGLALVRVHAKEGLLKFLMGYQR